MRQRNSNVYGTICTIVFMVLLFLLLWFVLIDYTPAEEEEGLVVSFGYTESGGGREDGLAAAQASEQSSQPAPTQPAHQELMTQEDESVAIQREEERKHREEQQRLEQQRLNEEHRAAEEKRKQQEAIDKANRMGALFGQTNNTEGSGGTEESVSSGVKGNPLGHGSSGGNSWSLNGRSLRGALPAPSNNFKQDGKVVVIIHVDANGNVISAKVGEGTTISDYQTCQIALNAAKKAKFNMVDRPDKAMGSITYIFEYK